MKPMYWVLGGLGIAGLLSLLPKGSGIAPAASEYVPIGTPPAATGSQSKNVLRWVPLVRGAQAFTQSEVPMARILSTIHHESGGNPKAMSYYRHGPSGDPRMPKSIEKADKDTRLQWMRDNWHGHAYGLGQLIPETGKQYAGIQGAGYALYPGQPGQSYDPALNILGTVRFLNHLWKVEGGDLDKIASAYYAGEAGGKHLDYEQNARKEDAVYAGVS